MPSRRNELHVPARFRRSAEPRDDEEPIKSAVWLIEHMCEHLGLEDLGSTELLDFGCGVKFSQALINCSLPIRKYVGIDVHREMVEFLHESVHDSRFEYFHIDAHNELYNPGGEALSEDTKLPIEGRSFDVICLFSVFTHLAPRDYQSVLKLLRRFVKPDGRLFFTLFIDELTEGGHGLMDKWSEGVRRMPPDKSAKYKARNPSGPETIDAFRDLHPDHPLEWAVFSERYARELIEGTGWEVVELSAPDIYIQHHFICAPS